MTEEVFKTCCRAYFPDCGFMNLPAGPYIVLYACGNNPLIIFFIEGKAVVNEVLLDEDMFLNLLKIFNGLGWRPLYRDNICPKIEKEISKTCGKEVK